MTDFCDPDEFYRVFEELLLAKGMVHEASILTESAKDIQASSWNSNFGVTSTGYTLKLSLPTELYIRVEDKARCEKLLKATAKEVFEAYDDDWIEHVRIVIGAMKRPNAVETNYHKACRLRQQALAACTKLDYSGPQDFDILRNFFANHIRFKMALPECLQRSTTLLELEEEFFALDAAACRSAIASDFATLISLSELELATPIDPLLLDVSSKPDLTYVFEAWQKALIRRNDDPEGAITAARTLLETVCKHILEAHNITFDDKADLPKLYSEVSKQLNMSPSQHSEDVFKQILGSCQSIVNSLGSLRNRLSDSHGRSRNAVKPAPRHAELAVNLAGTLSLFLIQTNESKIEKSS